MKLFDEKLPTEELQQLLSDAIAKRDELQNALDYGNKQIKRMQAELDRRELEAYWQRHPDIPKISAGDKLKTTLRALDFGGGNDPLGSIVTVTRAYYDGDRAIYIEIKLDNSWGVVSKPLPIALDMRRAYLASIETGGHDDR